jgi:hypothetical protein
MSIVEDENVPLYLAQGPAAGCSGDAETEAEAALAELRRTHQEVQALRDETLYRPPRFRKRGGHQVVRGEVDADLSAPSLELEWVHAAFPGPKRWHSHSAQPSRGPVMACEVLEFGGGGRRSMDVGLVRGKWVASPRSIRERRVTP